MKKQIFVTSLAVLVALAGIAPVLARGSEDFGIGKLVSQAQRAQNQASRTAQAQTNQLDNLKKRADKMVEVRINNLNRIVSRIENDKRLSADEKASLSVDIQTDINSLNALKAKIDADTDTAVARADAKQIVTNFKVFVVEEPKMRLLITIDNLSALEARLAGLTPKLQDLLNTLKSQGKDVSSAQSALDDINNRLQNISAKLANDKTTVLGVTVSTANPKATFVQVRKDLADVRANFAQIRQDVARMREVLKDLIKIQINKPSTSPTPTPTT